MQYKRLRNYKELMHPAEYNEFVSLGYYTADTRLPTKSAGLITEFTGGLKDIVTAIGAGALVLGIPGGIIAHNISQKAKAKRVQDRALQEKKRYYEDLYDSLRMAQEDDDVA